MGVKSGRKRMAALLAALMLPLAACAAGEDARPLTSDGREILTVASVGAQPGLDYLCAAFNAQSGEYYARIVEYGYEPDADAAPERLATELIAGRGPDIVAASGGNSLMQEAKDSGAFLELTPLLDELAPGLVPAVAEALRERPEIYDLPESFGISSFLAHPSQTGGRDSLTMEEAEACAAALGEGCGVFQQWMTREELYKRAMDDATGRYIDFEAGTCSFEDPGYIALLELCAACPAEPQGYENGGCLLMSYPLTSVEQLCTLERLYGDDYCFMGFPQEGEGRRGWLERRASTCFSVSAAGNTEGALEFIRFAFSTERQALAEGGLPLDQAALDALFAAALDGEYSQGTLAQRDVDAFYELLNSGLSFSERPDAVTLIMMEEARAFFAGGATAQEAAHRTQERVSLYLAEQA